MGGHTRQVFSKSSHSFVAPLLELAQTCYITYCIIHCVYIIEPGSTKYQFCSCLPQAWNFAPLWFVHRHPGFSATIFTTKHLFKVHTANTIDPFFAPWQGWEVPRETSKPQVKTLVWKHNQGLGSRSTATPGSAAPPQRCHSKQEGSRDRANHPDTCHTNTTAAPRTLYLCNLELWPLLQPVIHSMLSCESLTKHCLMWWRNTQSSQQGQNHTTTKLRDKDFSLKCLQFFIQIQILSGGAPPRLLECFLSGNSVLTQLLSCEPTDSSHDPQPRPKGSHFLVASLLSSPSAFAVKDRLVTAFHPPAVAAAALLAPPNQHLYNLIFTPFCRGTLKQTLHSLPPKLLPYFKAYWITLLLDKAPNSMITIHVWLRSQIWALIWWVSWHRELLSKLAVQA